MFILLDQNRTPVAEIIDYLSVTVSIRFSTPSLIDMTISETSDIAGLITELMYVYHVETRILFLIDYIQRDTILADSKAVVIKGNSIEGFLEQRVVFEDKLLEGDNLQASISSLIDKHAISPVDTTRTVDFYRFEDSTDTKVTGQNVKGLVSGISVMSAISSLLESKNLGYQTTYDLDTKLATFKILAGRNLCDGFTSILHGAHLSQVVTLSSRSETLRDIKSVIDLAPYKTRVYVKNFDDLKIFNRGTTQTGINLREGFLSTGHGDGLIGIPEIPLPPIPMLPPPTFPGEIPVPEPMPEANLIGLYVLTNKDRLLACAFYPDLPVPEIWFDVTPPQVDGVNIPLTPWGSKVSRTNGDLVIASTNRKKLYRASMVGGWFGSRYFEQAVPFFDVETIDIAAEITHSSRTGNVLGSLGMDPYVGRVVGTVVSTAVDGTSPGGAAHHARVFDGTTYDVSMVTDTQVVPVGYPVVGFSLLNINGDRITLSGGGGLGSILARFNGSSWENFGGTIAPAGYTQSWHATPEYGKDTIYVANVISSTGPHVFRSKDMFVSAIEDVVLADMFYPFSGEFSEDGKSIATLSTYGLKCLTTFAPGNLSESAMTVNANGLRCLRLSSAGIERATGKQQWGYMTTDTLEFYVTNKPDFSDAVCITPLFENYIRFGPYGVYPDGVFIEKPVYAWPILG
jgi:hypothetical protein